MSAGPHVSPWTPGEVRRWQLWARDAADRYDRTTRQVSDGDGRWRYNPELVAAADASFDARRQVAGVLGVPLADLGRCAGCDVPCHRYGDGGRPLCQTCQETLDRARAGSACP